MIAVSESAHAPGRRAAEEEGPAAVAGVQKARVVEGREHGFHFLQRGLAALFERRGNGAGIEWLGSGQQHRHLVDRARHAAISGSFCESEQSEGRDPTPPFLSFKCAILLCGQGLVGTP